MLGSCGSDSEDDAPTAEAALSEDPSRPEDPDTANAVSSSSWATGGTAGMVDAESYPDPFSELGESCRLLAALTQGPCWAPTAPVRQDISEGEPGLPLRLALRIVRGKECAPVAGAEIEIWYCNLDGAYSGEDIESQICANGNERARSSYFFRGRALSNATGKASFHGCYPGWYPGRAIHIHVLVRPAVDAGDITTGSAVVMSQLFFPEALTRNIFTSAEGYKEKGIPDTRLSTDGVLRSLDDISPFLVDTQQMTDGALLAWKTIALPDEVG